jgi:hypothetical protein
MGVPFLTRIPDETINQIMLQVDSQHALCQVVQCSKELYRIALPCLYRRIRFGRIRGHFRFLALRLIENPRLACYVRELEMRGEILCRGGEPIASSSEVSEQVKAAAHRYSLTAEEAELWIAQLGCEAYEDALLCLLLIHLPRLESLDVMLPTEPFLQPEYLTRLLARVAERNMPWNGTTVGILERLRQVMITCHGDRPFLHYPPGLGNFSVFLWLKELYFLAGETRQHYVLSAKPNQSSKFTYLKPKSINLEHIEIRCGPISPQRMEGILSYCTALKTFIHETVGYGYYPLNDIDIRRTLGSQEHSLENLSLNIFAFCESLKPLAHGTIGKPVEFTAFTSLKHLQIHPIYLFGVEVGLPVIEPDRLLRIFPPHLERLRIFHCESDLPRLLSTLPPLLQVINVHYPQLCELTFELPWAEKMTEDYEPVPFIERVLPIKEYNRDLASLRDIITNAANNVDRAKIRAFNNWAVLGMSIHPLLPKTVERMWGMDEDRVFTGGENGLNKRHPRQPVRLGL